MVLNVIEQLPSVGAPLQLSPVLAFTVTVPVGKAIPVPVTLPMTLNPMVTDWPADEGLGVTTVIVVLLPTLLTVIVVVAIACV